MFVILCSLVQAKTTNEMICSSSTVEGFSKYSKLTLITPVSIKNDPSIDKIIRINLNNDIATVVLDKTKHIMKKVNTSINIKGMVARYIRGNIILDIYDNNLVVMTMGKLGIMGFDCSEKYSNGSYSSNTKELKKKIDPKTISTYIQKMIDNNNGPIKVVTATYMDRVMALNNMVIIYFTVEIEELVSVVMIKRNIRREEALRLIQSQEFVENMKKGQSKSFHNAWCNNEAYKKVFKDGIEFSIHIYWNDRTPIVTDLRISELSCKKHDKLSNIETLSNSF